MAETGRSNVMSDTSPVASVGDERDGARIVELPRLEPLERRGDVLRGERRVVLDQVGIDGEDLEVVEVRRAHPLEALHRHHLELEVARFEVGLQQVRRGHRDLVHRHVGRGRRLLGRPDLARRGAEPDRRAERRVEADVEEHEVAPATRLLGRRRRARLDFVHPLPRSLRPGLVPAALQLGGELLQLLPRLGAPRRDAEQFGEHHADLVAAGELVRELLHVAKRVVPHALSRFMRSRYSIRFFLASPAMFLRAWSRASWM